MSVRFDHVAIAAKDKERSVRNVLRHGDGILLRNRTADAGRATQS